MGEVKRRKNAEGPLAAINSCVPDNLDKLIDHVSTMNEAADTGTGTGVWRLDILYGQIF